MSSPPANSMVPAVVIDIADRAAADPDAVVTIADLRKHERRYGRIDDGTAVLMYSGWGAKVGDTAAYRGADVAGVLHFPGFSVDACEWLLRRRRIQALGVDTLSIDPGNSATFEAHKVLNGADRYGIENLANLPRTPGNWRLRHRRSDSVQAGIGGTSQGARQLAIRLQRTGQGRFGMTAESTSRKIGSRSSVGPTTRAEVITMTGGAGITRMT